MTLEERVPVEVSKSERIAMTARCRDADWIPKVRNAGEICSEPDGTRVQIMHNGLKVLADGYDGAWMTELITRCKGHHEPQEESCFHKVIRCLSPTATMIELGGYWSYYSLWFLQGAPARKSYIVEPDPAHLVVGATNARLNGLTPTFLAGRAGGRSAPPSPFVTENSGELLVPCLSVPQLMEEQMIERLDLLHCDAQGVEFEVLSSCRELFLAGRIRWVFASTHVHHISHDPLIHQRCLSLLRDLGAQIVAEHDVHESFSGDGLIVAHFGSLPLDWEPPPLSYNRYSQSLFRNPLYDLSLANLKAQAAANAYDDRLERVLKRWYWSFCGWWRRR